MSILPIPTTRVSDYLTRSRLVQQNQADQLDLFRLQNQISTGRRIFQPSDDGRSALRSITLQRSLERKDQLQTNLSGAQTSLTVAETALNGVGDVLNDIRGRTVGIAGTTASDEERLTTRTDVLETLDRLVGFGNSTYQESYLFAGSQSLSAPYVSNGIYVEYRGNEASQQQRVDTGLLFDTNIPGSEVFGGLSEPVRGSANLAPQVNADTRLSDINGGQGITSGGSLEIGYLAFGSVVESESTVIDLSGARTLGDVARLIETGGPPSASLRASVTSTGLVIETNPEATNPGSIVIREVAGGETADELGVLTGTATSSVTGTTLDTILRGTTQLDDLLGTKAAGRLSLSGSDNDLILTANANGTSLDNLTVDIQTTAALGSETASFAAGSPPTLTVNIAPSGTTSSRIAEVINAQGTFTAEIDYRDATSAAQAGTGEVAAQNLTGATSGGGGASLDLASGLLISNGGEPFTVDTSGAETVEDLLNLLNEPENGLLAEINAAGAGIDIRTRRSGADFSIGEGDADNNGSGTLATQLGVRTTTTESRLEDFNRGTGVIIAPFEDNEGNIDPASLANNAFDIVVTDAGVTTTYQVDLAGDPSVASDDARTVGDVLQRIADATGGTYSNGVVTGGAVNASLSATGNGLTITPTNGAVPVATQASGSISLGGDTLNFDAAALGAADGAAGNQSFSLEVTDTPALGALTATVTAGPNGENVVVVDLGGTGPRSTADIAAAIDAQLADFNVTPTTGAGAVGATVGAQDFNASGGLNASPAGADTLIVRGDAAGRLGFFAANADPQQATSNTGSITSADVNTIEVDSVFNTLLRLADALEQGDAGVPEIARSLTRLDEDLDRSTAARGELGSRLQSLNTLEIRLQDEEVEVRAALSEELDVDLTQAISDFTARQFSLQASLQTTASILQLSLLNFL